MAQEIKIVPDGKALNVFVAEEFKRCAESAISANGRFSVALSGGSTPRPIYELIAEQYQALPWNKIHIFFGDERHVPPDHPDSNFRMANQALLSKVDLPAGNIHRIRAELDADVAAQEYENELRDFFHLTSPEWPRFDLILLGLGDNGHTASLFPGTPALQEKSRLVIASWVEELKTFRITFTYPVINHGAEDLFMVSGQGKAKILKEVLQPSGTESYPAQGVQPENGRLLWVADQAAAQLL
ncbi:MAG TPA: 6-phosphogluconolactonase [Candidatus Angelobacter sp.]|nr:6-phosphogluconolactonase [Candidatus Angelobacter sp.]